MTSAENSVSEPPNLKFSEGGYPQTLLQGSSEGNAPSPPLPPPPCAGVISGVAITTFVVLDRRTMLKLQVNCIFSKTTFSVKSGCVMTLLE